MRITRILALILLATALSSCITFEGQNLAYRYDRENDRLLIFQVYENIYCTGNSTNPANIAAVPTETEIREIDSVMKGQRTFFFANWIFEYNREETATNLEKMKKELQETNSAEKGRLDASIALVEQMITSISVTNGGFYMDSRGRLCGYQYVTISHVSKLLPKVNRLVSLYTQDQLSTTNITGELERKRIEDALKDGKWIRLEGNRLRITWVTDKDISEDFRQDREKKEGLIAGIATNIAVEYQKPLATITIGQENQRVTELSSPSTSAPFTNLVEYVQKAYGTKKKVRIDRLRSKFLAAGRIPE